MFQICTVCLSPTAAMRQPSPPPLLLLLLLLLLLCPAPSCASIELQVDFHRISPCLDSIPDGTTLDRWLACVEQEPEQGEDQEQEQPDLIGGSAVDCSAGTKWDSQLGFVAAGDGLEFGSEVDGQDDTSAHDAPPDPVDSDGGNGREAGAEVLVQIVEDGHEFGPSLGCQDDTSVPDAIPDPEHGDGGNGWESGVEGVLQTVENPHEFESSLVNQDDTSAHDAPQDPVVGERIPHLVSHILCGFLGMLLMRPWKGKRSLVTDDGSVEECEAAHQSVLGSVPSVTVAGHGDMSPPHGERVRKASSTSESWEATPVQESELLSVGGNVSAGALSAPLGMAIGTLFAEVLDASGSGSPLFSADQLSKILQVAMESQLLPVMGTACSPFVRDVKQTFRTTYNTLWSVRHAIPRVADVELSRAERLEPCQPEKVPGPSRVGSGTHKLVPGMATLAPVVEQAAAARVTCEVRSTVREACGEAVAMDASSVTDNPCLASGVTGKVPEAGHGWSDNEESCFSKCVNDVEEVVEENGSASAAYSSHTLENAVILAPPPQRPQLSGEEAILEVLVRNTKALEERNYYKQFEIVHKMKQLSLKEEQLQVSFESNQIMKQNVSLSKESNQIMRRNVDVSEDTKDIMKQGLELSRGRTLLKESEIEDRKLKLAYLELSKACADELVAGLCVMLLALSYGGWNYSYHRLSTMVSSCQPVAKVRHRSGWMGSGIYQSAVDSLSGHAQALMCEITVAGRMLAGTAIITLVASLLLRRSVTGASEAMPVSVIVIVLGVVCGFAGKLSVDSLGGSGLYWLLLWEGLCLLHAFASCFTPLLYRCLNGSPSHRGGSVPRRGQFLWLRRFLFHSSLVLFIPLMAGLVPFASFRLFVSRKWLVLLILVSRFGGSLQF